MLKTTREYRIHRISDIGLRIADVENNTGISDTQNIGYRIADCGCRNTTTQEERIAQEYRIADVLSFVPLLYPLSDIRNPLLFTCASSISAIRYPLLAIRLRRAPDGHQDRQKLIGFLKQFASQISRSELL